jgi:cation/acetate symporter
MAMTQAKHRVNPRLGSYFAIFGAGFVALVLLALIAEQMAAPKEWINWTVLLAPLVCYGAIGVASHTRNPLEFFAAGRRVPAIYGGFTLAFSALGGTGLVALTGTLFLVGFDALCLVIGGLAGFVVMGILLAPFFRKFGAYTIPSYLGRRFESTPVRLVAATVLVVPLMLMLIAEIKTAAFAGSFLTSLPPTQMAGVVTITLLATLWSGGMRALTWSGMAQTIAALLALIVPVAIVAVMWTNLPLPQFSYGPLMRTLARQEAAQGVPLVLAQGFTFDLPGDGISSIAKRFATSFSVVGRGGFVAGMLTILMGISVAPWLLPRIATAPGVYHARKSLGWATLLFGVIMLTAAAIAVFARGLLLENTMNGTIPDWVRELAARGYAEVDGKAVATLIDATRSLLGSIGLMRDVILYALPMAAGLPRAFVACAVAGAVAAALAGASACAMALAAQIGEDLVDGTKAEPPPDAARLATARVALAGVLASGGALAALLPGDPFDMLLWSLALTGSSLFSVLVLSIWWKRINAFGAVAGLISGFAVASLAILAGQANWMSIDAALAGMFGIPASLVASIAASLATPYPGRHVLELVRDIRVPGGEILYDREMRLLRLKKRQRLSNPV